MRIACITGSRADWNGLGMVAMALREAGHDVHVIATGQHGSPRDGTLGLIEADGFRPMLVPIPLGNEPAEVAEAAGVAVARLARALSDQKPALAFVVGDRYEALSAAFAAALLRIPIAHIAGGDVTEGSIDDRLRGAVTALASIHFPTNYESYARLRQRANALDYLSMSGSPALDRICVTPRVSRVTFFGEVMSKGANPNAKSIIVAVHPSLVEDEPQAIMSALNDLDGEAKPNWLLLGSNADAGAREIDRLMLIFKSACEDRAAFVANLPPSLYYSALEHCDLLCGNSSAGLYEAPSFGIPGLNIGDRQKGRLAAANVRTCAPTREAILHTMKLQLAEGRKPCTNPYGDGHSAPRIAKIIGEVFNATKPR